MTVWHTIDSYPDTSRRENGLWVDDAGPRVELLLGGGRIVSAQWRAEGNEWAWWEDGNPSPIGFYEPKAWRPVDR